MLEMHALVLGFVLLNFAVFIVAAKFTFDTSKAEPLSRFFVFTYLVLLSITVSAQYLVPATNKNRLLAAVPLLVVSLTLFVGAMVTTMRTPFTAIFSADRPTRIVTSGPYNYVRHPFYTAYMLTFFSSALGSDSPLAALCSCCVLGFYTWAARMEEEKFAKSEFAEAYADFRRRTGMFVPKFFGVENARGIVK